MIFAMVMFFGVFGILYWICAKIANVINQIPYIGPWIVKIIRTGFWASLCYPIFFIAVMVVLVLASGGAVLPATVGIVALIADLIVVFLFL